MTRPKLHRSPTQISRKTTLSREANRGTIAKEAPPAQTQQTFPDGLVRLMVKRKRMIPTTYTLGPQLQRLHPADMAPSVQTGITKDTSARLLTQAHTI